jgi:adenine phosphoribosyltransferase
MNDLKQKIRTIPDLPASGILFRDITTLLADPGAFNNVIERFVEHYQVEHYQSELLESPNFHSCQF